MGRWQEIDEFIDAALVLEHVPRLATLKHRYTRRTACYQLCDGKPKSFSGEKFVGRLVAEVGKALHRSDVSRVLESSWRWCPRSAYKEATQSLEVTLERSLARLFDENELTYQMATVAGSAPGSVHNRRAIDLVARHGRSAYELVELKMPREGNGKENPLAAAMELLVYAAFYLHFRRAIGPRSAKLGKEHRIFRASRIYLTVLGPDRFYNDTATAGGKRLALGWLEDELNRGVARGAAKTGCKMSFRFQRFLPEFEWPFVPPDSDEGEALRNAWKSRQQVYRRQRA